MRPDPQAILDSLQEAVVCFSPERVFLAANAAATQLWPDMDNSPSGPGPELANMQRVLADLTLPDGPTSSTRCYIEVNIHGSSTHVPALVSRHQIDADDFFMLVVPNAQQWRRHMNQRYDERKHFALGKLASGLEREFKNTLTTVVSALDSALASPLLPKGLQAGLREATTTARRAAESVQTLAMLSRSQKSPPDAIELRPVVDRVAVLLRQCLEPRIRLDVPLWPSDTWTVRAHANDVMEVLIQAALSVNDGIEEGGVLALTAENTALRSPAGKDGQFVRLTLSATAHESFAPDTSHQTSWVREPDAKWIHSIPSLSRVLKEMNAWIEVEQRGPKSAALHLLLPRGELNLVGEQPASGSLRSRKIDGKERILVVDDEELVRMVIRAILVHRGYQVIEADNGEAAVAKYLLAPDDFDLILIDMNMPRLSGRDALVQIRQRHPHVRAIILSGGMEDPDHGTAPGLEGVVFFRKPFDNQELLRTVRKSLDTPVAKG